MCGIKEDCPCPKTGCPRHGDCRACVEFHVGEGKKPPVCLRVKWSEYEC